MEERKCNTRTTNLTSIKNDKCTLRVQINTNYDKLRNKIIPFQKIEASLTCCKDWISKLLLLIFTQVQNLCSR